MAREGGDDISCAVALLPNLVHRFKSALHVLLEAGFQTALHLLWLRLIIHPEDRLPVDLPEGVEGGSGAKRQRDINETQRVSWR